MNNLSVNGQSGAPAQGAVARTKEGRYKGKRAYPSIPNQPSEAGAHFMFELAKTVLNKAGGTSSTSLFTQPSTSQNHHGPHRALHMCAFQLGLYALGLHNCVSPNWLSRTYSSHVSWITGKHKIVDDIKYLILSTRIHCTACIFLPRRYALSLIVESFEAAIRICAALSIFNAPF